jgi:outer membrane receptor for ferrienterochelin and colicins
MPVLSGLGALYGLDGLSTKSLSRVEITKGSGDALYGEEAIAGAVNLVSKTSSDTPSFRLEASIGSTNQPSLSFDYSRPLGAVAFGLSGAIESQIDRIDRDGDGLTDTPEYDRLQLSGKVESQVSSKVKATANFQALSETRFAGETSWQESDKGSAEVYGRYIESKRYQGQIGFDYQWFKRSEVQFRSALSDHLQDSFYGTTYFRGRQTIALLRGRLNQELNDYHQLRLELGLRSENYRDNLQTEVETDYRYIVSGLTLQHWWQPDYRWTLLYGLRLTHYNDYGWVVTPRASLHWRPNPDWAFRLSGGTGFKPVNIFSTEKAVHAGFQEVRLSQELDPERSLAGSFAVNRRFIWPTAVLLFDLNLYYTHFLKKVVVEHGERPGALVYTLDDDGAFSQGLEMKGILNLSNGMKASLGWNWIQAFYHKDGKRQRAQMQSRYSGEVGIGWAHSQSNLTFDLDGAIYGPQPLPEGRPREESPTFSVWNLRLQKGLGNVNLFVGFKNLFDYVQPDDPFIRTDTGNNESFDSAMIYGPLLGRVIYGGINFKL